MRSGRNDSALAVPKTIYGSNWPKRPSPNPFHIPPHLISATLPSSSNPNAISSGFPPQAATGNRFSHQPPSVVGPTSPSRLARPRQKFLKLGGERWRDLIRKSHQFRLLVIDRKFDLEFFPLSWPFQGHCLDTSTANRGWRDWTLKGRKSSL